MSTSTLSGRRVIPGPWTQVALAEFRAGASEIAALRKSPDPTGRLTVAPGLLRHADEQTVVGLAALFRAIGEGGLDATSFGDWSVVVAPRYLGRSAFERAFPTFREEGAWGVSPHLIPAHSLHSPSGAISQAIGAHGPNLGVGGSAGGEDEAFLLAATWISLGDVPGVWVVLTGRTTELDGTVPPGDFEALAVALVPAPAPSGSIPPPHFRAPVALPDREDRSETWQ